MHALPTEVLTTEKTPSSPGFRHVRQKLDYNDIAAIREEFGRFLRLHSLSGEDTGNFLLALTEILTNLIKHPARKATHIEILSHFSGSSFELEVLDNSTPFADFDAKCKTALSALNAAASGAESGYGLGCILTLYESAHYTGMEASRDRLNHFKIRHTPRTAPPPPQKENKPKIFLIDDDPASLTIHHRMLEDAYDIISFSSAAQALSDFPGCKPDLIISDLHMPEMDGIALRKALDGLENGDTTPFVFLSGYSNNEHNPYISQLGVDDFLCKPVSKERLQTVLTRLLHRSRQVRLSVQGRFHHDITELLKPALPEKFGQWTMRTLHLATEAGGGDFILHQQSPTNMMVVLADVMGHGRQAKFFSYAYAGYLRSMFRLYAGSLDAPHFLKYLSQSVDGDSLLENIIMTCQCFQLFPEGVLKISSAGHPCPILLRGKDAEFIDIKGPLLGLIGDSPYDIKSVRLTPGDKIIFMTDGFMEAFDRRGKASEELIGRLADMPASSAQALSEYLWAAFRDRQKKSLEAKDDATIIIAEYGESI